MIKRLLPIILSFSLLLCTNVLAQQAKLTTDAPAAETEAGGLQQDTNVPPSDNGAAVQTPGANNAPGAGNFPGGNFNPENSGMNGNNSQMPQNMPSQNGAFGNAQGGQGFENMPDMSQFAEQMPNFGGNNGGGNPWKMQNGTQAEQIQQDTGFMGFVKTNFTPIASAVLLLFAFIFVIFYKRKKF